MKKLFILIFGCIVFVSCNDWDSNSAEVMDKMKCPVTMIAEHPRDSISYGSIVLQGADGKSKAFVCKYAFSQAISDTFNPGDTVKKCK